MLSTLKIILSYRSVLLPAIVGFVAAVAAVMGRHIDIGKLQSLVDTTGTLATIGAGIAGKVMDAKNAATKTALANSAAAININASQLNTVTPPGMTAAKVITDPPVVIVPASVVEKSNPLETK